MCIRDRAEAIETMGIRIDKVLELQVEDNVIVDRMSGRRVCEKCGASYHIVMCIRDSLMSRATLRRRSPSTMMLA